MTRGEVTGATVTTLIAYLASPDILNKWETVLFMAVIWCACVAAIWSLEEFQHRIRRARRIARRRRHLVNIDYSHTGLIDERGKEVKRVG